MHALPAGRLSAVLAVALALWGCGEHSKSWGATCDATATASACYDYSGAGYSQDLVAAMCTGGSVGTSPCPSANRVGTCRLEAAGQLVSLYSTGGSPYTAETAQARCTDLGGVFTAG
jgi:hypothetical protein